jgi:hypothetical protein
MPKQQFCLNHPDFFSLEATIMENLRRKGYDYEEYARYATGSSVSPFAQLTSPAIKLHPLP